MMVNRGGNVTTTDDMSADPVAITVHQPHASLLAHEIKLWETRPHPPAGWPGIPEGVRRMPGCRIEPGQEVWVHSAARLGREMDGPAGMIGTADKPMAVWWTVHRHDQIMVKHGVGFGTDADVYDLPLGAVLSRHRVTDVVPIVAEWDMAALAPYMRPMRSMLVHRVTDADNTDEAHDISDQLPYGDWTPGRWAWRMELIERLETPVSEYAVPAENAGCSVSYCAGANGWSGPEYPICDGCNADGTRMAPVRGRQGVWRPDPALVAAVRSRTDGC